MRILARTFLLAAGFAAAWFASTLQAAPFAGGFVKSEAAQMLNLALEVEGYGVNCKAGEKNCGLPVREVAPYLPLADGSTPASVCTDLPHTAPEWKLIAEGWDPGNLGNDICGFGPFHSRWKLWQRGSEPIYAVAIRGTIADWASIEEDLMTNPMQAEKIVVPTMNRQKSIRFRLASTYYRKLDEAADFPVAEVHAGFTYGMASILFDEKNGLLKAIQKLPPHAAFYVTGHSQGAAVATLLHSFLHYACAENKYLLVAEENRADFADCGNFGLTGKDFQIKSYVFAQPKPGNWRYAMDLAQIAGNAGRFYAVNNYDDPVPQVPFAIQFLSDSLTKQEMDALGRPLRFLEFFVKLSNSIRRGLSGAIDEAELDDKMNRQAHIDPAFANSGSKDAANGGSSLNFTPAGHVIAVRAGKRDDEAYLKVAPYDDFLREHHLWRYDQLSKYWPE